MSLINPISAVRSKPTGLLRSPESPESTGVLGSKPPTPASIFGAKSSPVSVASIFGSPPGGIGETTGVNSRSSGGSSTSASSGSGGGLNVRT